MCLLLLFWGEAMALTGHMCVCTKTVCIRRILRKIQGRESSRTHVTVRIWHDFHFVANERRMGGGGCPVSSLLARSQFVSNVSVINNTNKQQNLNARKFRRKYDYRNSSSSSSSHGSVLVVCRGQLGSKHWAKVKTMVFKFMFCFCCSRCCSRFLRIFLFYDSVCCGCICLPTTVR